MQSTRFSVFAIALSAGALIAGCSGSPSANQATIPDAAGAPGSAGAASALGSAGSGAQAGALVLLVPQETAGNTGVGGSPSVPYPDRLPDGFSAANMFGGYLVGDAISAEPGQPGETPNTNSEGCGTTILAVIRDFKIDGQNFGGDKIGDDKKMVQPTLGPDRKPVFAPSGPTLTVKDPSQFNDWYRTVDGLNKAYKLEIWFGPNNGVSSFQSTEFFPLDGKGWNDLDQEFGHNFFFTTEIHTRFKYEGGESFKFTGDDDVWVFINGKLAIDLGGVHPAAEAAIDIDARAVELGLEKGKVYPFDMFQNERHTYQSNFRADTNLNFVDCGTIVPEIPK
ncbi:MAG TPA: fibro-slime domain-containing protein [Polyangiaceae bacterium]|nr:fibro-slime domain-containing protein [Polyangiaceae bacterium]